MVNLGLGNKQRHTDTSDAPSMSLRHTLLLEGPNLFLRLPQTGQAVASDHINLCPGCRDPEGQHCCGARESVALRPQCLHVAVPGPSLAGTARPNKASLGANPTPAATGTVSPVPELDILYPCIIRVAGGWGHLSVTSSS